MTSTHFSAPKTARRGAKSSYAVLGLAAIVLAGCNTIDKGYVYSIPATSVQDRHPIKLAGEPVSVAFPMSEKTRKMTKTERADLEVFLHGYKKNGAGPLSIATPVQTKNEIAAGHFVSQVRDVMYHHGLSEDILIIDEYVPDTGKFGFPVVLKYHVSDIVLPRCGHHGDNLAGDMQNLQHEDFGCSQQRNLGAMVSNPHDLRTPRAQTPRSGNRRATVFDNYTQGQPTATQTSEDGGTISQVGE